MIAMPPCSHVSPDEIRAHFASAMSAMYRQEVPSYGTLLDLVKEVNQQTLNAHPALKARLSSDNTCARLDVERHGAIRLGTPQELETCRRVFTVMGMFPVGYYDLSVAGIPVHSTAFRPLDEVALSRSPFRIFTSLLRPELIADKELRQTALDVLQKRDIFIPETKNLLELHDRNGGLTSAEADRFVSTTLETFRWHREASVSANTYHQLHAAHRLVADIVCFKGPHINHLTPRTLDIDAVQKQMPERGMQAKARIEGPPERLVPLLLRQTSFTALKEEIIFANGEAGTHTARFGEIEQRGIALTPKGRALYDTLLEQARQESTTPYEQRLVEAFRAFPDDEQELRRQKLAFFRYVLTTQTVPAGRSLEGLIAEGAIVAIPITYEDFLPVSAAGIFQSNLGEHKTAATMQAASRLAFEKALGAPVHDEMALYEAMQAASLEQLGLTETELCNA
ncbi:VOC family protein [Gluconobacter potus]|uniref:2-oxoadipate dioxygenase/decarboxylase HglS n=1 Tax=Gluconobacter potus TaxID=2724927 RepID=UPI0039EADCF9